jgi:small subunit ribosomal protein S10
MINNLETKLNKNKKVKVYFKIKSFHFKNFDKSLQKISSKMEYLNIKDSKIISLPNKNKHYTLLRSPHIDKKSREQFKIQSFTKLLIIEYDFQDNSNIKYLINYITNTLSGCQLKITYIIK